MLTHCFRPFPNAPIAPDGKVREEILAARARGVIFDIGHGGGSFGFGTTRFAAILGEHRRLVEAIARGDQVLAVHIAQEHSEGAKQDLLRRMEETGF